MMFSPSRRRSNLTVPWQAGCDGPICSSMISDSGSAAMARFFRDSSVLTFSARRRSKGSDASVAFRPRVGDRIALGRQRLALLVRIGLAQRVPDELRVHED